MATLTSITIDCQDATRLATFWAAALDGYMTDEAHQVLNPTGDGPTIYFKQVPEPKSGKNRVHLDITTSDPKVTSSASSETERRSSVRWMKAATTLGGNGRPRR